MTITVENYGPSAVLKCKGDLNVDSLDAFKRTVDHQLQDASVRDLVVNLEGVSFVDSLCLEYLLELQQRLNERLGQVKLACPDANVAKILEMTRLESAFERFSELSEAVKTG